MEGASSEYTKKYKRLGILVKINYLDASPPKCQPDNIIMAGNGQAYEVSNFKKKKFQIPKKKKTMQASLNELVAGIGELNPKRLKNAGYYNFMIWFDIF